MDCRSGCGALVVLPSISVADTRNAEWQADEYRDACSFRKITCALSLARLYARSSGLQPTGDMG